MANLASSFKSITFAERTLMLLNVVALMVRYFFHFQADFFMEVFAILLTLLYFPFGFYAIGKPGEQYSYTISIILGFVYALGQVSLLISAANVESYRYPLIADFFVLLAVVIYLMFRMRREKYPDVFINTQYLRIGYFVLIGLIILLKSMPA
jgi:hypothetical protein